MSKFVHLHRHSEYSTLDGCGTNKMYASRAAEMGQPALALTDHGTLGGALHHIAACQDAGILPIVGCEAYYRPNRKVQGQKELRWDYYHLVLLAKDGRGWKNLMQIISESHDTGFYEKPCVDLELLRRYHEGLMCGTACLGGWLAQAIEKGDSTGADQWLRDLKAIFGDDLFVEIMPSHLDDQVSRNVDLVRVAQEHSVMITTTCDAHTPYKEWVDTQDILLMIATNQTVEKREKKRREGEDVFEFKDPTYYLTSEDEIRENYASHHPDLPQSIIDESIVNTMEIASRVSPFLVGRHDKLPQFKRDRPDIEILRTLCYEGLKRRGTDQDPRYTERIEDELAQIHERGVAAYFLMVHDVIEWATSDRGLPDKNGIEQPGQKEPIEVGPGRGSAGGSLVSDSIGITNLDPIAYGLLFERFLNPNRKGLPDIDVDFPSDRIDEVEDYTKARFGKDHVLDVVAHATFGPRGSIRKVGRVLCLPSREIDETCKSIDEQDRSPLEELRVVNSLVDGIAIRYPDAWKHMVRIQGQIAGKGEHAAALLVTPPNMPVKEVIPVERIGGQKGKLITGWGERAGKGNAIISDYGYNKFDWLRVAELDKQIEACRLIRERHGDEVVLRDLPVHRDPYATEDAVMKGFGDGLLTGIFQFSATAARLTRRVKPDNIIDLAAINALIRPGPRGHGDDAAFVERKHGRAEVTFWHPSLEPFLGNTLGILVFQEQLIQVVHVLGGLPRADADNFRKIASKLYRDPEYAREVMGEWKVPIFEGFTKNGIEEDKAEQIWTNFLSFSDYSFNLSHAAGYAVLAYRDMWLKIHYASEFYAAFLSKGLPAKKEKKGPAKEAAVREARSLDIKILPPDINTSGFGYSVTDDGIRLGINSIKDVGPVATKEIIAKRPFLNYDDFAARVEARKCNRTSKAALVSAGAFDCWDMRDDLTEEKIDELEREYIGISLTSTYSVHNYRDIIDPRIHTEEEFDATPDDEIVCVAGEVINIKEVTDRKGKKMCFVDLAYGPNEWSITFFAHMYGFYKDLLESRRPIIVIGKKDTYNGRSSVKPLSPEQQHSPDGDPLVTIDADGQEHKVYTHYVQDVHELAQLVRDAVPAAA